MKTSFVVFVLAVVACAATSRAKALPKAAPLGGDRVPALGCDNRPCRDVARDYELGHGVPRDYVAAARFLALGCDRADLIACRKLGVAIVNTRGVAKDDRRARQLFQRACKGGDVVSCYLDAHHFNHGTNTEELLLDGKSAMQLDAACKGGDLEACQVGYEFDRYRGMVDEAEAEADRKQAMSLCQQGVMPICALVVNDMYQLCRPTCTASDLDEAGPTATSALGLLNKACASGDEDSCVLPGTVPSEAQRCREGDFRSCTLAESEQAARRACEEGGLALSCTDLADRYRDGEVDRTAEARALYQRACALRAVADSPDQIGCDDAKNPELATGCGALYPQRTDPKHRPKLATAMGAAANKLPSKLPLLLVRGPEIRDLSFDRVAIARPASISPGVHMIALVEDANTVDTNITVVVVKSIAAIMGGAYFLVVDANGLIRASISSPAPFPASLGRCVNALLAEP